MKTPFKNIFRRSAARGSGQSSGGEPDPGAASLMLSPPLSTMNDELQFLGQPTPSTVAPPVAQCATETTPPLTSTNQPPSSDGISNIPTLPKQYEPQVCDKPVLLPFRSGAFDPTSIARDLGREAFEKLPKQTQQELHMEETEQKPLEMQIRELLNVTKKRQEECEQKFWKFRLGDHEIVLRDYAVKIVGCLQKVGDVAITFAPPQASLPWSAVKMVMQTAVVEDAQMCALLASVEKIVRIFNRGQVYEIVYTAENTPKLAFENLQSTLVELYGTSMELLANSSKLFAKNTAKRTVYAILYPGDTADVFSKLVGLETKLSHEAQACESGRSSATDAKLINLLQQLDAPITRVDERVCTVLELVDKDERRKILEWISSIPYGDNHETVKEARTSGTCEWLLRHERLREWWNTSSSVILWLQGSPGAGKTFLTSMVIDYVQNTLKASPNHEGFAFFYCNRNEDERRNPRSVLQSYVRQLSTTAESTDSIRIKLRALYHEATSNGRSVLSFDECKELLLESVNLYPKTTLVLDALDECEQDSRGQLVGAIEYLLSESKRPLKVFISSRPDADIRERFLSRPNIKIQATDNQEDIEKFINGEIVKHRRWKKISPSLQEYIVRTLLERSDGMFQWAYLQIKQLLELKTELDLRDRLGKLPTGLKAAYDEMYSKISKHEHGKAIADQAFMWVMCACKPLESVELLSVISLNLDGDKIDVSDEVDEDLVLDLCNNLLVLDSQRKVWRFSHLSVTEYFEEYHWSLQQAHCHVARVCLKLLLEIYKIPDNKSKADSEDDSEPCGNLDLNYSLQRYIRHHWITHVRTQEGQEANPMLARLLRDFLGSPNKSTLQYRAWYHQTSSDRYSSIPSTSGFRDIFWDEISPESAAVLIMCRFSLYTPLLDWWATAEIELSQLNSRYENLLTLAALSGCKPICEALIERGIQINAPSPSSYFSSALVAAAHSRSTEVLKLLVEKGADLNMLLQTGKYGSVLAAAVVWRDIKIIKFLVDKGADVNMPLQTGIYGSALAAAILEKDIKIVKFLVDKGADVNMLLQPGVYGSALAAAVAWGDMNIVKFLVDKGADLNMPLENGDYGSALVAAAIGAHMEIIKFLVDKGADVNMLLKNGDHGSALTAAIASAHGDGGSSVRFLVEKGANVNMLLQSGSWWYGSALIAAAGRGNIEVVKFLVEKGALINLAPQTGLQGSALAAAASAGFIDIVKFLVDNGADIYMPHQTGNYGSALEDAAVQGKIEVMEFLMERQADVNVPLRTSSFGCALTNAACYWQTKSVELLMDKGADVLLQSGHDGSALAAAADLGATDIVKLLVEKGVDVNMLLHSGIFGSALAAAAWKGRTNTVSFLVEKQADVNMLLHTGNSGSALVAAIEGGELEVTKCLLAAGANVNLHTLIGRYRTALVAAAHWGRKECVEALIEAGAEVNARLDSGPFHTALQASQSDVSLEDHERVCWDERGEEDLKREKGEVMELLQRYGATEV